MNIARKRLRWWSGVGLTGCALLFGGCVSLGQGQEEPLQPPPVEALPALPTPPAENLAASAPPAENLAVSAPPTENLAAPTPAADCPPPFDPKEIFLPGTEVMPIDLPTALRIADAGNPTIALARERVAQANAELRQARLLWLPDLIANPSYYRHDGDIQNSIGLVFTSGKSYVSAVGGSMLDIDSGNALFAPLIARRLAAAQAAASQAVNNNIQLDVALAYLDLLRTYAALAINTDLLARNREVLRQTQAANDTGTAITGAEINRARVEVRLREEERIRFKGDVRVASSRLARLLLLQPTVALLPAEPTVLPITLVPESSNVNDLVDLGVMTRPELAASRELVAASRERLRQTRLAPLLPHLTVYYEAGEFGGGQDSSVATFNGRGDGGAMAIWDWKNLGFGNLAADRERRTEVNQANYHVLEVQAQVEDEVNAAFQIAVARRDVLDLAQDAIRQALEEYRKLYDLSIGRGAPRKGLDTLQPLLALQTLAQARTQYLNAVVEYDRAQFQLYTALGRPTAESLPKATAVPTTVPTAPTPYQPPQ